MKRGSFILFAMFFFLTMASLLALFSTIETEGVSGVFLFVVCLSCFGAGYNCYVG
jgi:hypothetical protein